MFPYRIYTLDEADRIAGVIETECSNDEEALAAACEVSEPNAPVEVWQFSRCLGTVRGGTRQDGRATPPRPSAAVGRVLSPCGLA